jgi:hypothetical protein
MTKRSSKNLESDQPKSPKIVLGDRLDSLGLFVGSAHEKITTFTFIDDTGAASHLSVADVIRRIHVNR